jgi:hypothetical protein
VVVLDERRVDAAGGIAIGAVALEEPAARVGEHLRHDDDATGELGRLELHDANSGTTRGRAGREP